MYVVFLFFLMLYPGMGQGKNHRTLQNALSLTKDKTKSKALSAAKKIDGQHPDI